MTYSGIQTRAAYKRLPPEMQEFALSNETSDAIDAALKLLALQKGQADDIDSEVRYILFGLQTFDTAMQHIETLTGKSTDELGPFRKSLEDTIIKQWNNFGIDQNDLVEANRHAIVSAPEVAPVLSTPEVQAIQAALPAPTEQPMTLIAPQSTTTTPSAPTIIVEKIITPAVEPQKFYPGGKDPYREPIE